MPSKYRTPNTKHRHLQSVHCYDGIIVHDTIILFLFYFFHIYVGFSFLFHGNWKLCRFVVQRSMYWMQKIIMKPRSETACTISHFFFHLSLGIKHQGFLVGTYTLPAPLLKNAKSREGITPTGFQCSRASLTFLPFIPSYYYLLTIFDVWIWWFIRIIFLLKFMTQSMNATGYQENFIWKKDRRYELWSKYEVPWYAVYYLD